MVANVLVTIFYDDEWIEILQQLENKCDWKIRYLVGLPEMEMKARTTFDGVIFEDVGRFLTGLECTGESLLESPEIVALPEIPFDFVLLDKLSKYEFMIKYLINREYEKGSDKTNEIYFALLSYWLKIIDSTKPSLIISPFIPYTSREYVLFALSQVLNIKFLSFRQSPITNYLYNPITNPHNIFISEIVRKYNCLKNASEESAVNPSALKRFREMADLQSEVILNDNGNMITSSVTQSMPMFAMEYISNGLQEIVSRREYTLRRFLRRVLSVGTGLIKQLKGFRKLKSLKRVYDSYCILPDYECPYILFPLHYQPEWSTAPLGGYAVYQDLCIEMISRSLPHGWKVYVKEHYTTFSPLGWGWKKRSSEYYERIATLSNVILIPIEIPTARLIDGSQAVATVTGSIGIEAVARSKPALTFGSAWYNGCNGVFPIHDHSGCKEVIENIKRGVVVDPAQMLLFIQASESVGAKVNFSYTMKGTGDEQITREDTINNMVRCISRWWTNHLPL
jgi:hypothetical protein